MQCGFSCGWPTREVFPGRPPILASASPRFRGGYRISKPSLAQTYSLRTTRALNLTEAGEKFYARAKAILEDFEEAEAEVRGLNNEAVGQLRISVPHSLSRVVIAPALSGFMKRYPDLTLDIISDDTYTDIVQEGRRPCLPSW